MLVASRSPSSLPRGSTSTDSTHQEVQPGHQGSGTFTVRAGPPQADVAGVARPHACEPHAHRGNLNTGLAALVHAIEDFHALSRGAGRARQREPSCIILQTALHAIADPRACPAGLVGHAVENHLADRSRMPLSDSRQALAKGRPISLSFKGHLLQGLPPTPLPPAPARPKLATVAPTRMPSETERQACQFEHELRVALCSSASCPSLTSPASAAREGSPTPSFLATMAT